MRRTRDRNVAIDRRLAGIAVLVLAVVAAAVVGARNAKYLTGLPGPAPVADPPAVGDCLTSPMGQDVYPAVASTGSCHGPRYGEVVAVMPHTLEQVAQDNNDSADMSTTPEGRCITKGLQFLGLSYPIVQGSATDPATWFPSTNLGSSLIQPNPLAQRFGADWTACVVAVYSNSGGTTRYSGTLGQVHITRDYPQAAAICWSDLPLNETPVVPCREPHGVEEFGNMWDVDSSTRPADLHGSCLDLVKQMTGMDDPTAAGALQVRAIQSYTYPAADHQQTLLAGYSCIVQAAAGKQLTGPLLNLHDGPLPVR